MSISISPLTNIRINQILKEMKTSTHQRVERGTDLAVTSDYGNLQTPGLVDQAEIVDYCSKTTPTGRGVVRLRGFAIKFGRISDEEVANQIRASQLLDPNIILVPMIYCYFTEAGRQYLVMEHIDGCTQHLTQIRNVIPALARAVVYMHTFTSDKPGPVNGGSCTGTLWPQDEQTVLQSREDLEQRVRARLLDKKYSFYLDNSPLVFTHGDLSLRNILFLGDRICLLDWEFAGYFPRSAEIAVLYQDYGENMDDLHFRDHLAKAILVQQPLTKTESDQVDSWLEFAFNGIRFSWTQKDKEPTRKKKRKPTYVDPELRADDSFEVLDDV